MTMRISPNYSDNNPVQIEIFKNLFSAIAEEMGVVLRKASFSPNIKERRDFSCAIFDSNGDMVAQAAHIPVHLGAMPLSVKSAIAKFSTGSGAIHQGDTIILNDPYLGGTHLPDITLITPIYIDDDLNPKTNDASGISVEQPTKKPFAYLANRAHHADIGGITAGSMPIAKEIYQEGLIIPPVKLIEAGNINRGILDILLANVRTPEERTGDIFGQIGANQRGVKLIEELVIRYGHKQVALSMKELLLYTERLTRKLISDLPNGRYNFEDYLDDNGSNQKSIRIKVTITIEGDSAIVDFTGSAPQQEGSVNAVYAITSSAVNYVFRSLLALDVPNNSGCLIPIKIIAPLGSIVNAQRPAPVAGGNVETSQRIVDVLLGALAKACPGKIPAASQGTMNNISIGGLDSEKQRYFTYYETIGGGTGASALQEGASAVHSHMTNTLNTPIEALEYAYPFQVVKYEIRKNSGGAGFHQGGDGIIRQLKFFDEAQVTLITERRLISPYGLMGGEPGKKGENLLLRNSETIHLPGKVSINVIKDDILSIETPGGGGYGQIHAPDMTTNQVDEI